jgi:outer membrane receptor protein involved in Fe transport
MSIIRAAYLAGTAMVFLPGVAYAQAEEAPAVDTEQPAETVGFRPIIVTAQRREESLQDVPLA